MTQGYPELISLIKTRMKSKYGIGRDFDSIIITSGAQQVIDLPTKVLCNEGDVVICESPSFIGSLNCFRSYNANLVGVPVDADGINIEALEKALDENPNAKMIYTIPNFQNPAGVTMSLEKRRKLYELAKAHNVMILEDNPYGDLRVAGEECSEYKELRRGRNRHLFRLVLEDSRARHPYRLHGRSRSCSREDDRRRAGGSMFTRPS